MFIGMFTGSYAEILLDIVSGIFLTFLSLSFLHLFVVFPSYLMLFGRSWGLNTRRYV